MPLGRYLIGEDRASGAHRRYARPGELSFFDSYTAVDKGQREGRPRQAFDKVWLSSAGRRIYSEFHILETSSQMYTGFPITQVDSGS